MLPDPWAILESMSARGDLQESSLFVLLFRPLRGGHWEPWLVLKVRISCPLCQQFPRADERSKFQLLSTNRQHCKFRKFRNVFNIELCFSVFQLHSITIVPMIAGGGAPDGTACIPWVKILSNFNDIRTGDPGVPEAHSQTPDLTIQVREK